MSEYYSGSGAYFVKRGGKNNGRRAAGVLILVLLLLSAAICLLVIFLPKLTAVTSGQSGFDGKIFYFMSVGKYTVRDDAVLSAQDTINRGGAGYIYNDGSYNVVASVYDNESDAKAISSVNENSYYFQVSIPKISSVDTSDISALKYFTEDWFEAVRSAADELQRGNSTESQAECVAAEACFRLAVLSESVTVPELKTALITASEYACPQNVQVLSYIRYVHVRAIAFVANALNQ